MFHKEHSYETRMLRYDNWTFIMYANVSRDLGDYEMARHEARRMLFVMPQYDCCVQQSDFRVVCSRILRQVSA